ncbi:MAG: hypothetical protein JG776_734 [Caloramator sp.]|jgi:threonine/homoserine/homoserine lactone efflux protein|uniref:LysE family translocator n=1 Tax=Caloramator sp. TaxID=1871330 RepID=UPI001D8E55F5|nr:LysE family transporter [Caloramator sp.]MBZ4663052.1 hypothetical protein [Caloramator sp.]
MRNFILLIRTIITGLFTGVAFALPLGPAGLESIKRTVNSGINEGLMVAIGAVLADAFDILFINIGLFSLLNQNKRTEGLFFIICGLLILFFAFQDIKNYNGDRDENIKKYDSKPVLKGFIIAFTNPMTHSFWLTISGTLIHRFSDMKPIYYYIFLIFIIVGMFIWFVFLNLAALKGIQRLENNKNNEIVEKLTIVIMFLIGIGFIVFGLYNLINLKRVIK